MSDPVIQVKDLRTQFHTDDGLVRAVDGVTFDVLPREVFAIVGESGSGKSVTALSILNLIPKPAGEIAEGEILFNGRNLLGLSEKEMQNIRGNRISMIFQDPLTALNPVFSVGDQIAEVFVRHRGSTKKKAFASAISLLEIVGIPRPAERAREYPHQFSGGMRQRAMIAMAVALNPDVIIADEPTTALDVTVQAQILEVLLKVKEEFNAAIILITHDLGVVAGIADRVMVMYAGKVAEMGQCHDIYYSPKHPYTWGLMTSVTRLDQAVDGRLLPIKGAPPSLLTRWFSCPFSPRCPYVQEICTTDYPHLRPAGGPGQVAACHFAQEPEWKPPVELVAEKAS